MYMHMYMCMCMRRYLRGRCPCTVCGQNANKGEGMRAEAPRGRAGSAAVRNGHFPPLIMPLSLTLHIYKYLRLRATLRCERCPWRCPPLSVLSRAER